MGGRGQSTRAIVVGGLAIVNVIIGLPGCGPSRPEYQDPLAGLSKAYAADVPEDVPVKAGHPVALTLGSNVDRYLKYSDDGAKYAASVGASQRLLASADPQYLVDRSVAILRRHYPSIKAVDDLAAAARQHFATTFVLDLRTKAGMYPGDDTTVDIIIIALDSQQNPISRLVGHGSSLIRPYVEPNPREAMDKALLELNAKADTLLN